MPVPFDVAQGVGRLRREIAGKLPGGAASAAGFVRSEYPVDAEASRKMVSFVKQQKGFGHLPDDREILIEFARADEGYHVVIHTCFGSLVNETIGRVLTALLSGRMGSVGLQTDPYRIMIRIQSPRWKDVIETFRYMEPDSLDKMMDISLARSELFHWRFLHVANRLGIIDRNADFGKGYLSKVADAYLGTPAYEEALSEIKREKLDIETSKKMLGKIQSGEIKIVVREGLSPMGRSGLERKYEIVAPERPETEILEAFRKRLLGTKLRLVCCGCGGWNVTSRVSEKPLLQCPKCGARMIGATHHWDMESEKALKKHLEKKKLSASEKRHLSHIQNTGTLVMNYGEPALKALAGRGVGWTNAKRILAEARDDDDLCRLILEAERRYARTKRFWKD